MTFDHIDQMVRNANPVPDPNALESAIATVSMINQHGSSQPHTRNLVQDPPTNDRRRRGWLVAAGAGVVAVAAMAAVFVLNAGDEDLAEPAAPTTTVTPVVPTTVEPVVPSTIAPVVTVPPTDSPPLGLELVGLDGSTSNLGLPADAWMADLSPDGSKIAFITASTEVAFCGGCAEGKVRLAIVPVSSGTGRFVYFEEEKFITIGQPTWSPDGTKLAFQGDYYGNLDIYVADLSADDDAGTRPGFFDIPTTRLTTDPGVDEFPAWSLDGTVIYYDNLGAGTVTSGMADTGEIWSVPVSGGEPTRLTNNDVPDMQPDVGPDGRVAYWSGGEIWTMAPDGSSQQHLATVPWDLGWNPRWSPDGTKLALLRYEPRSPWAIFEPNPIHETDLPPMDVVVVDVASGEVTDLGVQVASFYNPVSWTPDGNSLLVTRYR